MPRLLNRAPKLRRHATGQAVVTISGRDIYCGRFNTSAARAKYREIVREYFAFGHTLPMADESVLVKQLILAYWQHAKTYYRRKVDGKQTSAAGKIKRVLRDLRRLFGSLPVEEFGPLKLQALRQQWVTAGYSRSTCNAYTRLIVAAFRWGAANELVSGECYKALTAVESLRPGRTEAPDGVGVRPVSPWTVKAMLRHCSPTVAAMVRFQWRVGCRPDEVCSMRLADIDQSRDVWEYRPVHHKTIHHGQGHERVILIGPKAQKILRSFAEHGESLHVFSPRRAERERLEKRHQGRRTPMSCGNRPGSNRKARPKRHPRDRYTTDTYGRAIRRACEKAGVAAFAPNQLRHNAATRLRARHGLEAAQVILGHRSITVTQVYAERNLYDGRRIAAKTG